MPETATHLDNSLIFRKNDIGMSRQIFDMKPEAESMTEKE